MHKFHQYSPEFELSIREWAQKRETEKRFAHTERVVDMATRLANRWLPEAVTVCRLAGWIHDASKHKAPERLYKLALRYGVEVSQAEKQNPSLLHGVVAYHQAARKFNLHDEQLRTACAYHTTGSPQMNFVDKLFFLADLIEPERDFPLVNTLREMAFTDVDKAMLLAIDGTLRYLLTSKRMVDPRVILLYNRLLEREFPHPVELDLDV